ncbi:hypothetical protein UFOVP447_76 [uncultured Caudovirales phage]|uniref:Uncharacterized protein n=1 Tax=uncultured Caudovirales phage TaxID=2100421 RepID=A0A6J5MAD1_9CAUD|nr:hypothetical protein UFOVP447_76 [uncultured Caudovirales phage]
MTIPNPPSFSSVRTEFNNAGMGLASNLFAYRRGGGIVPNISYYNAVGLGTSESPLRLSQFAGLEGSAIATLTNHSGQVEHTVNAAQGEASTFAELIVNNNGALTIQGSTGWSAFYFSQGSILIDNVQYWGDSQSGAISPVVNVQNWLIGGGAAAYSCRGTIQAGSTSPDGFTTFRTGTFGSWLSLAGSPSFIVQSSATSSFPSSSITLVMLLEFARTDNLSNILGSCTITLSGASDFSQGPPEPIP